MAVDGVTLTSSIKVGSTQTAVYIYRWRPLRIHLIINMEHDYAYIGPATRCDEMGHFPAILNF